jgi:hypothetical protein
MKAFIKTVFYAIKMICLVILGFIESKMLKK